MKHLTIILTSAALALSVLNACASPKDGNEFKETALSGTPVRMDIPDTPINSVLSNTMYSIIPSPHRYACWTDIFTSSRSGMIPTTALTEQKTTAR